jgi:hypothetical protein
MKTNTGTENSEILIKSKRRVADHGEVFTSEREVNAMLDLVKQETERIDSRFLEPACGNGNFLVEILKRKMTVVVNRYSRSDKEFELYAIIALSSIYGIEILEDNVISCRERIFIVFISFFKNIYLFLPSNNYINVARFILERNILWGDALNLRTPDEKAEPLIFSEWSFINNRVKRRDFAYHKLINSREAVTESLFSDLGDTAFIPNPVKEYPLINYIEIADADENELQS